MEYAEILVILIVGIILVISGFVSRLRYRMGFTHHAKGEVVSSHCETHTEYGNNRYDMYATINYEVKGKEYQANFEFKDSKKYYHFLSQGNRVNLLYSSQNPQDVQIKRLFIHKGTRRITWGFAIIAIVVLIKICYGDM